MVITVGLANNHHCTELQVVSLSKFSSLLIVQICNTVLLTVVLITVVNAVHYILGTYLFYNWKLVPFDTFTHFAHPPTTLPLAPTNLSSISMN